MSIALLNSLWESCAGVNESPKGVDSDDNSMHSASSHDMSELEWIAKKTKGFSGSDLRELCSQTAQHVLGEHVVNEHRRIQQGGALASQ